LCRSTACDFLPRNSTEQNRFSKGPQKWLCGADSVEDPNFLDTNAFIPLTPSVHILITTRSSIAPKITPLEAVEVQKMEQREAIDLFWKISGLVQADATSEHLEAAESIAKELGYLALATGSYIQSLSDFFQIWPCLYQSTGKKTTGPPCPKTK
jgi:hypothetical protein